MSLRSFFSVLYLSVVIESKKCLFYGEAYKGSKPLKTVKSEFDNDDTGAVSAKAKEYLKNLQKEYKWVYVSLFFDALSQGALGPKNMSALEKTGIDPKELTFINPAPGWIFYVKTQDVKKAENLFSDTDVSLLYSPLALVHDRILSQNLVGKNALYVYAHREICAICIVHKNISKFAAVCKLEESSEETAFDKVRSSEIDDFIESVDEDFANFDGVESLDELLKLDGSADEFEDLGYDINMPASTDVATSVSIFGRDMSMYGYISLALKEFYTNPLYESDFIEDVVIFDATERTSATLLHYLQNELLVKTEVYPVDTQKIMTELMIKELKND